MGHVVLVVGRWWVVVVVGRHSGSNGRMCGTAIEVLCVVLCTFLHHIIAKIRKL